MGAEQTGGEGGGDRGDREPPVAGRVGIDGSGVARPLDAGARAVLGEAAEHLVGRRLLDAAEAGAPAVATVGHELRSPLTSIRGYTSLLRNRWARLDDADKLAMLDQIHHDAERVTRLINELLDISRIESGRLTLARRAVDLAPLVDHVLGRLAVTYPDLDAEVVVPPGGLVVHADADKLEQVLTNLVENAVKYGDPRGLRVEVAPTGDGGARVSVGDRGPGIAPGDLERIFDRWYQREHGRPTGTGLGLWISRSLIEAHGGTLVARSTPGEGAAFTFTLPAAAAP